VEKIVETIESRVVVVTGAGGGIGGAVCRVFHETGAVVVALFREQKEYTTLRKDKVFRERLSGIKVDVTREEEIAKAVTKIRRDHGTIDVLVNCAGVGYFGPIETLETTNWKEMVDVNLSGTFLMTREVVKVMKAGGGGMIINIASLAGLKGYPKCSGYGATKAGIIGLSRSLAEELIPNGIRVVAICPGSVDTPFQDNIPKIIPREKMIQPEDVARTALFVADLPERAMIEDVVIRPRVIS
jgi:NAD(P)-dependent dehydrogenase (short-subunit alcohol dehydrogenase family)